MSVLQTVGFEIDARRLYIREAGVEVDIIATNRHDISFYITCKGSWNGRTPGCKRTDTLKKALHEATALHNAGFDPVLLLTSHLPEHGSARVMLDNTDPDVLFDALSPIESQPRLKWMAEATEEELRDDLNQRRTLFNIKRQSRGFTRWNTEE